MRRLTKIGRLFTGTPAGVIEKASVILDDEHIAWCGREGDEPLELMGYVSEDEDCGGGLVTAGPDRRAHAPRLRGQPDGRGGDADRGRLLSGDRARRVAASSPR